MAPLYTWQGVTNALLLERLTDQRVERLAAERAKKEAEERMAQLVVEQDEEKRRFREKTLVEAKAEADSMIEAFDDETERMRKEIERLTKANDALQYENQGLRAKLEAVDQEPILFLGDEFEFYPGEIKELILSVLEDTIPNLLQGSRRYDVVNDIVQNNNCVSGITLLRLLNLLKGKYKVRTNMLRKRKLPSYQEKNLKKLCGFTLRKLPVKKKSESN